jgi:septum formation topological specificity factor MinE
MNLFPFLRPIRSAPVALERLHTVLEYDRCLIGQTDLIPILHTDILAAINRYITIDTDKVQVRFIAWPIPPACVAAAARTTAFPERRGAGWRQY